jgi:hypothetical protein
MPTDRDNRSQAVPEVFAIKGQAFGQLVLMDGEPAVERVGQGVGVCFVGEVVEGIIAWHDEAPLFIAHVESDGFALALAQGSAAFPDCFDIRGAGEQSVGDEDEHCNFGIPSGVGTAVIGDFVKGVREASQVFVVESTTRSGHALACSFLIDLGERRRAGKKVSGLFINWINPILFWAFFYVGFRGREIF